MGGALVTHVASRPGHSFSKTLQTEVRLIAGLGVEGDGHAGATVQHRSRVAKDPSQPNLRQVFTLMALNVLKKPSCVARLLARKWTSSMTSTSRSR